MQDKSKLTSKEFIETAKQTMSIYWSLIWQYKFRTIFALVTLPLGTLTFSVAMPYVTGLIVDKVASGDFKEGASVYDEFGVLIALFLATSLTGNVMWRVVGYHMADLQAKLIRNAESHVFDWLSLHSYKFYANSFSGALVAQHKRFIGAFERVMDMLYFDVYRIAVITVFGIAIVATQIPIAGAILTVWSLLFLIMSLWLNILKSKHSRLFAASDTHVTAHIADFITNILSVKVFSSVKREREEFEKRTENKRRHFRTMVWYNETIFWIQGLFILASHFIMLSVLLQMLVNGETTIGTVLFIQLYWSLLSRELFFVGRFVGRIEIAFSDAAEMTTILNTPHDVEDPAEPEKLSIKKGEIEFKDVHFRYEDGNSTKDEDLFKKLKLTIPAGQKVGLVGPSGGGKTTITKLMLRFMDLQKGSINIDGQDISKISQDDLRDQIAYVPQEPLLFHRTIRENIGYAQPGSDLKVVKKAAKLARADVFIDKLKQGYETLVGERGIKLSGGEKQRVAVARAILKDAPILLLDEATSALDSESEKLIQEALEDLMKDRTTIVIAHRLSTIQKLDRILVVKEGEIVEDGTHAELLKKKGLYAELWSHQSGGFLDE